MDAKVVGTRDGGIRAKSWKSGADEMVFPRSAGNIGEQYRWEYFTGTRARVWCRARNSSAKGWRTCTTIKPSDLRPTLYGPRPDAPALRIFRRFSVDLEPGLLLFRSRFPRSNISFPLFLPPFPLRFVEIRRHCSRSNSADRRRSKKWRPEKRLAFGADGTRIRLARGELRREKEKERERTVGKICFITSGSYVEWTWLMRPLLVLFPVLLLRVEVSRA